MKLSLASASLPLASVLLAAAILAGDSGPPQERSVHRLRSSVVGIAGSPGASEHFRSNGTAGQPSPIGISSSGANVLHSGFWWNGFLGPSALEPPVEALRYALSLSRPNPSSGATAITFSLVRQEKATLRIFDATGRLVRNLIDGTVDGGVHQVNWDGRDDANVAVASGVYFYELRTPNFVSSRKLMLVR